MFMLSGTVISIMSYDSINVNCYVSEKISMKLWRLFVCE